MKFAIEPRGVDNPVGFRAVPPNERALAPHETFFHEAQSVNEIEALVLGADGRSLRAKTSDDLAADARAKKLIELKALRDAIRFDAFLHTDGSWYDCSAESQASIIGEAVAELVADVEVDTAFEMIPAWRDADDAWHHVEDKKTLRKLAKSMRKHVQACFTAFAYHEDQLRVEVDPGAYSFASDHWPNTRIDIN